MIGVGDELLDALGNRGVSVSRVPRSGGAYLAMSVRGGRELRHVSHLRRLAFCLAYPAFTRWASSE
jgi:hypothetical protein